MKTNTDPKLINNLLTRGVENIYPSREFLDDKLKAGKKLRLYLGVDPTGSTLHLGHAINLIKLKQFQDLGHDIVFLIGSFTAMIGDPSDKLATRKPLTREQVLDNCKKYKEQAAKILDMKKVKLVYNHKWFDKMTFRKVMDLTGYFTVSQFLERDMYQARLKQGKEIGLHEFLYPLMQAYDSIELDVDGEVGGNDQTFNMLAGRTLMKKMKGKEKFVLTNKLLEDPSGKKMGKTEGNMITLEDDANEMFGKVMAWPDGMIVLGFELCTLESLDQVEEVKKRMKKGENPRDLKLELAEAVVKIYYGEKAAIKAKEGFLKMFQQKQAPDKMPEFALANKNIVDALVKSNLAKSKGEARRLVEQNGVKINDQAVKDANAVVKSNDVIKKGKRFFIKIK